MRLRVAAFADPARRAKLLAAPPDVEKAIAESAAGLRLEEPDRGDG